MKKLIALTLAALMLLSLSALADEAPVYKIGICNYVDHASLNQIVDNLTAQLKVLGAEKGVTFEIMYDNANADGGQMQMIITKFIDEKVDLMVGIATPVAMTMQGMTEDNQIPVVFAAVSDPLAVELVASLEQPGANITGTSDYLNTDALIDLIFAVNPDAHKIGFLYDLGQDAATTPVNTARALLKAKGIEIIERNGSNAQEVMQAAEALASDQVDAVFTPTDNTIMDAESAICEIFQEAKIPHYAGADSFALNGAFLGFGVDYANLGRETANMAAEILVDGKKPAEVPVKTFPNGTATLNVETVEAMGLDLAAVKEAIAPYCSSIVETVTAENFSGLNN